MQLSGIGPGQGPGGGPHSKWDCEDEKRLFRHAKLMGPKKRANASVPAPLVPGEYMTMLREFNRDSKRIRKNDHSANSNPKSDLIDTLSQSSTPIAKPQAEHKEPSADPSEVPPQDSDSDLDSDEFEDVQLGDTDGENDSYPSESKNDDLILSFNSEQASKFTRGPKAQGLSKPKRLLLHKVSLAAWLFHARLRNEWLLKKELLENPVLTSLLPRAIVEELFPPDHLTPFLKSKRFIDGLRHAMEIWQAKFRVVRPGIASILTQDDELRGDSGDMVEYISQILSLSGSLDLEGQGFVALLRSYGLEARLVCSLQPPDNLTGDTQISSKKTATSSAYPIFWCEVWDANVNKWVSLDSVTSTVKLPTRNKVKLKLEPPLSDRLNVLRYCVALDSGNNVRDVTSRYSSNFNSRTRKKRLPHFESDEWLVRFFGQFANPKPTPFDKDEILELSRYPRLEGIPTRIQDFVGHPEYALVEQLRHNEVLRPGAKPCGILSIKAKGLKAAKKPAGAKPSYIYSRSDVLNARSSQSWYRHGRSIKVGAQPQTRRSRKNKLTGELESVALYTHDQTELFQPPQIEEDGTVPKSQFRTIDVFMDSMIPKGGSYIKSNHGTRAAKLLRIDFANVVTGVEFGRSGPRSHMFGVIVASQHAPAMRAVISGLLDLEKDHAEKFEEVRILGLWRKFIMGAQIWERVEKMNPSTHAEEADQPSDHSKRETNDTEKSDTEKPCQTEFSPQSSVTPKAESEVESDLEMIDEKPLLPQMKRTTKYIRFSDAALQHVKNRVLSSGLIGDGFEIVGSAKVQGEIHGKQLQGHKAPESPDSYHSFSDLDVDEISESEL